MLMVIHNPKSSQKIFISPMFDEVAPISFHWHMECHQLCIIIILTKLIKSLLRFLHLAVYMLMMLYEILQPTATGHALRLATHQVGSFNHIIFFSNPSLTLHTKHDSIKTNFFLCKHYRDISLAEKTLYLNIIQQKHIHWNLIITLILDSIRNQCYIRIVL